MVWSFAHCWECMTEEKQYSCGNCSKITKTFNLLSKDRHLGQETCRSRVCNFILPEFIGAYHKPLRMLPGSLGMQKENKPKSHQNSTSAVPVPVQCALCRCVLTSQVYLLSRLPFLLAPSSHCNLVSFCFKPHKLL